MGHGIEQGDRGKGRLGNGNHDAQENLQIVAAIDLRRFFDAVRQPLKEIFHDDHVIGADRDGKPERPVCVQHMQVIDDQVVGNHAGIEQHEDDDHAHHDLASRQVFF